MRSAIGPALETDTTVASQSTKVLASGGSFQAMYGELVGVIQDRPVQNPPFISKANLLWKEFHYPTDIDFRNNHTPYFALRRFTLLDCWQ